ncbi:MAG: polyketide cyclase [Deltaproteobacteria bacterium]|nr:polyketide cyclase [Deltaproteobacteria bacterium]MBU47321.1 polyketide cyclase [Deltaproteobacteria bacterium]|tara:strand:+ start:1157 stop:1510 length:354 start_codon:yes stop_codon:yes gene_type:complete
MIDNTFAQEFASDWIDSWNTHDLERILAHYTDDFEMTSPIIIERMGVPSGTLKGKQAIRDYWGLGLQRNPTLHFELVQVFVSANSILIHYNGHKGPSAEYLYFDDQRKVVKAVAHYT